MIPLGSYSTRYLSGISLYVCSSDEIAQATRVFEFGVAARAIGSALGQKDRAAKGVNGARQDRSSFRGTLGRHQVVGILRAESRQRCSQQQHRQQIRRASHHATRAFIYMLLCACLHEVSSYAMTLSRMCCRIVSHMSHQFGAHYIWSVFRELKVARRLMCGERPLTYDRRSRFLNQPLKERVG